MTIIYTKEKHKVYHQRYYINKRKNYLKSTTLRSFNYLKYLIIESELKFVAIFLSI